MSRDAFGKSRRSTQTTQDSQRLPRSENEPLVVRSGASSVTVSADGILIVADKIEVRK